MALSWVLIWIGEAMSWDNSRTLAEVLPAWVSIWILRTCARSEDSLLCRERLADGDICPFISASCEVPTVCLSICWGVPLLDSMGSKGLCSTWEGPWQASALPLVSSCLSCLSVLPSSHTFVRDGSFHSRRLGRTWYGSKNRGSKFGKQWPWMTP